MSELTNTKFLTITKERNNARYHKRKAAKVRALMADVIFSLSELIPQPEPNKQDPLKP